MNDSLALWRKHIWRWLPALVFLLVNISLALTYRVMYSGQAEGLESRVSRQRQETEEAAAERLGRQRLLDTAQANYENKEAFYVDTLSTESQRFTRTIAEVKDLASRAGLEPTSISYPKDEFADFGLVKRSIVFSVEGNYASLREFVNFLELSDSFVTLEKLELADSGESKETLRLRFGLSTLFVDERSAVDSAVLAGEQS